MKRTVAIVLSISVLLTALPARAADHLVSLSDMQARLSQAAAQRQADLEAVRSALLSPAGVSAATRVGLDARAWVGGVSVLSDDELQDLAERTALLQTDPAGGGTGKALLIIGLVVLVLFLVYLAVWWIGCSGQPRGNLCGDPGPRGPR